MSDVQVKLNDVGRGSIVINEDGKQVGEMVIGISGGNMTVYHTEVAPEMQGKGLAGKLFDKMISHAKGSDLKIIPLCAYVLAQFKRHPEKYADIWNQKWHQ